MTKNSLFFSFFVSLFFSFVFFSYLVSQELFTQFDFDTTVKIQDKIPRGWDAPFSILSIIGTLEVTGLVWLAILIFSILKNWWKVFFALALFPLSHFFELFGKLFLLHPSPPFMFFRGTLPFNFPSGWVHTDYSYPSGHATRTAFLVVIFVFLANKYLTGWVKWFAYLLLITFIFLMFVSRVYLGEHWTTDVIGGALLGSSFGVLAAITFPNHQPRKGTPFEAKKT